MAAPENRKKIGVGADFRVELDTDHLDMVCGTGAYKLVIWIRDMTLSRMAKPEPCYGFQFDPF